MSDTVRVAVAQIAPKMGDVEGNVGKILEGIERARRSQAHLVLFPELSTAGYLSQGLFLEAAERERGLLSRLLEACRGIYAVFGIVEDTEMGVLYNSALVLGEGRIIEGEWSSSTTRSYRKCYLPTYGMFEEKRWFAPGHGVPVFPVKPAGVRPFKLGVLICEDLWQPLPARIAAMRGASVVAILASSPKTLDKPRVVDALLKARAIENTVYAIYVNAAGSQDLVTFWGGSKVVGPNGEVLAEGRLNEEDFFLAELDLYRLRKFRETHPYLRDERMEMIEDYMNAYREMVRS
jgi:predicted amidohydrolase